MRYSLVTLVQTCFFFFFQAEDGIRDDLVTGVQTCALPIYNKIKTQSSPLPRCGGGGVLRAPETETRCTRVLREQLHPRRSLAAAVYWGGIEIGRASCRERV